MPDALHIERITSPGDIPFQLLLLADETLEAIANYIYDSDVYVVKLADFPEPVAVVVLQALNSREIEIKNIAVEPGLQGRGIGSLLIAEAIKIALQQDRPIIWVGTPDVSAREIRFYERAGFLRAGIKKNFFIDNYAEPIFENGIRLKDMLMLKMDISNQGKNKEPDASTSGR